LGSGFSHLAIFRIPGEFRTSQESGPDNFECLNEEQRSFPPTHQPKATKLGPPAAAVPGLLAARCGARSLPSFPAPCADAEAVGIVATKRAQAQMATEHSVLPVRMLARKGGRRARAHASAGACSCACVSSS
jgi:hypothetical protein